MLVCMADSQGDEKLKELLTAIKAQLQTDLTYIRDLDIYVTPHANYIPNATRLPCVGIKDGGISRNELPGGMWGVTLTVKLVVYVQLAKEEASIMGDTASSKKGVLDIVDDIHTTLDENLLDITDMQEAFSSAESESEMFGDDEDAVQRKIVTYQYVKEEDRA